MDEISPSDVSRLGLIARADENVDVRELYRLLGMIDDNDALSAGQYLAGLTPFSSLNYRAARFAVAARRWVVVQRRGDTYESCPEYLKQRKRTRIVRPGVCLDRER